MAFAVGVGSGVGVAIEWLEMGRMEGRMEGKMEGKMRGLGMVVGGVGSGMMMVVPSVVVGMGGGNGWVTGMRWAEVGGLLMTVGWGMIGVGKGRTGVWVGEGLAVVVWGVGAGMGMEWWRVGGVVVGWMVYVWSMQSVDVWLTRDGVLRPHLAHHPYPV